MSTIKCPDCGNEQDAVTRFCSMCGHRFDQSDIIKPNAENDDYPASLQEKSDLSPEIEEETELGTAAISLMIEMRSEQETAAVSLAKKAKTEKNQLTKSSAIETGEKPSSEESHSKPANPKPAPQSTQQQPYQQQPYQQQPYQQQPYWLQSLFQLSSGEIFKKSGFAVFGFIFLILETWFLLYFGFSAFIIVYLWIISIGDIAVSFFLNQDKKKEIIIESVFRGLGIPVIIALMIRFHCVPILIVGYLIFEVICISVKISQSQESKLTEVLEFIVGAIFLICLYNGYQSYKYIEVVKQLSFADTDYKTVLENSMEDVKWECTKRGRFTIIETTYDGNGGPFEAVVTVSGIATDDDSSFPLEMVFNVSKEREKAVLVGMRSDGNEITDEDDMSTVLFGLYLIAYRNGINTDLYPDAQDFGGISDSTDDFSDLITPGKYSCYYYDSGEFVYHSKDFDSMNTILLTVYAENTAILYKNLYWDDEEGDYGHEENTFYLTYDEDAFYLDGELFCNYQFNANNMHLDLSYMDFESYDFVIDEYY